MYKTLIAGITALSLSIAPAPAAATGLTEEQVGRILFGLVAAGVVGAAIKNSRSNSGSSAPQATQPHVTRPAPQQHVAPRQQPRGWVQRTAPEVLPSACMRSVETARGAQRIFGQRCLNNNYAHAANLPRECAVRLHTNNGPRRGYGARCLRGHGYRSDRRH